MIEGDPLEVAGWRFVDGQLRSEDLPGLATDALIEGRDSPSLRMLAGQSPADVRESADLFRQALDELGIPLLSHDEALWSLIRMTARSIVDGGMRPAAGANEIWATGYLRVEDSGDLRIFVGLASMLDDHPEDLVAIEKQILAESQALLPRPRPRRWVRLKAPEGLSRDAGDHYAEVAPTGLPISAELATRVADWAAELPAAGFDSVGQAEAYVQDGQDLLARLGAELGPGYRVEYRPEPTRPPGIRLAGRRF